MSESINKNQNLIEKIKKTLKFKSPENRKNQNQITPQLKNP